MDQSNDLAVALPVKASGGSRPPDWQTDNHGPQCLSAALLLLDCRRNDNFNQHAGTEVRHTYSGAGSAVNCH